MPACQLARRLVCSPRPACRPARLPARSSLSARQLARSSPPTAELNLRRRLSVGLLVTAQPVCSSRLVTARLPTRSSDCSGSTDLPNIWPFDEKFVSLCQTIYLLGRKFIYSREKFVTLRETFTSLRKQFATLCETFAYSGKSYLLTRNIHLSALDIWLLE